VKEFAMGILTLILLGLVIGVVAKWITPGPDPGGFLLTIVIGIAGAVLGGFIGQLLGAGSVTGFNLPSLALGVVGALILLFGHRRLASRAS
jgi:uncharacterized membrane protein YeaQ/YmgE (transglycosylase-associated protein family)